MTTVEVVMVRYTLACALLVGCSGKDGGGGGDGPSDSGSPPPTTDTTIPPTTDTDTTAPPVLETVRVRTYGDEQPIGGLDVLVSAADGSVVGLVTTGADGEAQVDIPPGGSVTFAEDLDGTFYLTTAYDVPDGGTAAFSSFRFVGSYTTTDPIGNVYEITTNAGLWPLESVRWLFHTRCDGGNAGSPGPWVFDNAGCVGQPTDHLLVVAFDANDELVGWGAEMDFPLTSDVTVDVAVNRTDFLEVEAEAIDLPVGVSEVHWSMSPYHPGWHTYYESYNDPLVGDSAARTLRVPDMDYDGVSVYVSASIGEDRGLGTSAYGPTPPASLTLDGGSVPLVDVEPPDLDDLARPVVRWIATTAEPTDMGFAYLSWSNDADYHSWSAKFDPSARSEVQLPELPPEWADYGSDPVLVTPASVQLYQADFLGPWPDAAEWSYSYPESYEMTTTWGSGGDYVYL